VPKIYSLIGWIFQRSSCQKPHCLWNCYPSCHFFGIKNVTKTKHFPWGFHKNAELLIALNYCIDAFKFLIFRGPSLSCTATCAIRTYHH
jgi:hypothetical protein